jgi:glycosyltransferase involved in cell wall biosynthesis
MKQVWILNHYAQTLDSSTGTRHLHIGSQLPKHGWKAVIIASSFDNSKNYQRLFDSEKKRLELSDDVPFLWVKSPKYKGNGLGRMVNILIFTMRLLQRKTMADLSPPDVVIGSSVHPFAALAGALLARRFNVPFIFEVRDLWPETLIEMGRIKSSSAMAWALRKLELWLYKRSSRVVVLMPKASEYIVAQGIDRNKVVWIPNGVDLKLFPRNVDQLPRDVFTLIYFGSLNHANALNCVVSAMKLVEQSPDGQKINLEIVGDGLNKPALIAQVRELGLQNVSFSPSIPKRNVPKLAAQADAFVLSVLDLPNLYCYGISMNKLFEYLALSRPIIIASGAANNPVSEAQAGLSVSPGRPELLAQAILQMAATPLKERNCMGRKGRQFVEQNHNFDYLTALLAKTLDETFSQNQIRRCNPNGRR